MQKILITGAAGALGRSLIEEFLKYPSVELYALVRKIEQTSLFKNQNVRFITGDVCTPEKWTSSLHCHPLQLIDTIIHAAALTKESFGKKLFITNVIGTEKMLNTALEFGTIKHFIFISSIAVFGENQGIHREVFDNEIDKSGLMTKYGRSKLEAEKVTRLITEKNKIRCSIVRPSIIYGPWSSWTVDPLKLIYRGIPIVLSPKNGGDGYFVYIDDVARLLAILATQNNFNSPNMVYNIVGEKLPWYQFVHYYSQILGKKERYIPEKILRTASVFSKNARILYSILKGGRSYEQNNISTLGFKFSYHVYEGMEKIRDWLKQSPKHLKVSNKLQIRTPTFNVIFPSRVWYANSELDVIEAVKLCSKKGWKLRPKGGLFSFSNIYETDGVLLDISSLKNLNSIENGIAKVHSGACLGWLTTELARRGWELPYAGAMKDQTIAGAIATGTHGCSPRYGSLASSVEAIKLVDGNGKIRILNAKEQKNDFQSTLIGLGSTGIITEISLKVRPLQVYSETKIQLPITDIFSNEKIWKLGENADFWYILAFPKLGHANMYCYTAENKPVKKLTSKRVAVTRLEILMLRYGMPFFAPIKSRFIYPVVCRPIHWLSNCFKRKIYGHLCGLFAADPYGATKHYPLYDLEIAVSNSNVGEAVKEISSWYELKNSNNKSLKSFHRWGFPRIHIRPQREEPFSLSGSYMKDICWLEIWIDKRMLDREFENFQKFYHSRLSPFGYRVHWGKNSPIINSYIANEYSDKKNFEKVLNNFDPKKIFMNNWVYEAMGSTEKPNGKNDAPFT